MEIYLVGGAVRDGMLDYPVAERDWVVVGARPEDLLTRGFQQVGKDFPVFTPSLAQSANAGTVTLASP